MPANPPPAQLLPVEHCTTCNIPLIGGYMACDETMGHYCEKCWSFVECDEKHGEGCATSVWSDQSSGDCLDSLRVCPSCGALPCDWTGDPFNTPERGELASLVEALEAARDLIDCIEQRSNDNCWWVNVADPETAVCDTHSAIEDALHALSASPEGRG